MDPLYIVKFGYKEYHAATRNIALKMDSSLVEQYQKIRIVFIGLFKLKMPAAKV